MKTRTELKLILEQGLQTYGMSSLAGPLLSYLELLNKWNNAYNLTAVRNINDMIYKHVLDSLAIADWIKGPRVLDVGTGPGLPGIPLALAFPHIQWILLDSNGKKIRFLHEVKRQLGLKQVEIIEQRVEVYQDSQDFDTVLSRAFSSLEQMIQWTKHLIAKDGIWLAMKGTIPESELAKIKLPYKVEQYVVEGVDGERCCILIDNT